MPRPVPPATPAPPGACIPMRGFTTEHVSCEPVGMVERRGELEGWSKHLILTSSPPFPRYALKKAKWDEAYHWGHNDAKGRVGDFILGQGQSGMKSSVLTVGPYMDMLLDGMFVPKEQSDGSFVWANSAVSGKIPLIALEDVGFYCLWALDHPENSAGLDLEIATDEVSFADIARIFTEVTGKKASHQHVPLEKYLVVAEPYPNAYANWAAGRDAPRDESVMTWRQNFSAWWRYWGESVCGPRNMQLLDSIHPNRIKSLADWMTKVGYDGTQRPVLKGLDDLRTKASAN